MKQGEKVERGRKKAGIKKEKIRPEKNYNAPRVRGGARRTSLVPRSESQGGGVQPAHQRPVLLQPLGKTEIPANLCLFSHSTNIPSADCAGAKETALLWDSEMIIGDSVLLGPLF